MRDDNKEAFPILLPPPTECLLIEPGATDLRPAEKRGGGWLELGLGFDGGVGAVRS